MTETHYSFIAVHGDDAFEFLQGQLTADLRELAGDGSIKTAWCNPKGRVICLMTATLHGDGYGLALPSELADEVVRRLTMFRFRAKVDFEIGPASEQQLGMNAAAENAMLDSLRAGRAEVWQAQSEKFTPHMLNLDLLGVVSLDKGCFPGQEVVARTYYRGATKRRCLRFESSEPVSAGDKVAADQRDIGEVVNAIGNDLLAVVPLDKADGPLTVNGVPLTLVPLPYM